MSPEDCRLERKITVPILTWRVCMAIRNKQATLMFQPVQRLQEESWICKAILNLSIRENQSVHLKMIFDLDLQPQFEWYYTQYVWYLFFRRVPKMAQDFKLLNIEPHVVQCIVHHMTKYQTDGWVHATYDSDKRFIEFEFYQGEPHDNPYNTCRFNFTG